MPLAAPSSRSETSALVLKGVNRNFTTEYTAIYHSMGYRILKTRLVEAINKV